MSTPDRFHKDKSERWLLQHQAGSILRLAGITGFTTWTVEESSLIAPRRLPDGLVNVNFPDREKPVPVLIEIESYSNKDAERQMFEALLLARLELGVIPEGICVVLQPKGRVRVREKMLATSEVGSSKVSASWKVIEIWRLSAKELLAQKELGFIPWVPLTKIDGPVEPVLRECRKRIDRQAPERQREAYLAVTQILGRLVYPEELLEAIFKGEKPMIDSPFFTDLEAKFAHRSILKQLAYRYGEIPEDLKQELRKVRNTESLDRLLEAVISSTDLPDFRVTLHSVPKQ